LSFKGGTIDLRGMGLTVLASKANRATIPGEVRRGAGDCAGIESPESLDFSGRLKEHT